MTLSKSDVHYIQNNPKKVADEINGKLTANKVTTQANSTAIDVAGVVADLNALIAKLKSAGVML